MNPVRDAIYAKLHERLDRFPVKDSQLECDLHAVPLEELNETAAQKEDEAHERRREQSLWERKHIQSAVERKHAFNATRPPRHGGKKS